MFKRVAMLFALVAMLSVTFMIPSSPVNASQSLQMSAVAIDPCDVDFNGNGEVDVGDIMVVASRWRSTDPSEISLYDLDDDGDIDVVDIMIVAAQWGNLCPAFAIDMGGLDTDLSMRDLAAAAGFRWVRTFVQWGSVEPDPPVGDVHNYNWPDSQFDVYRNDRRLIPLVTVAAPNPSWAAVPEDPRSCGPIKAANLDDFGEFVFQLVSRYSDVAPYWVFYNEQDHWTNRTGDDDAGGCWGGYGAEYAQMLAVAWDAAHSANPYTQVIFGATAYEPEWHPDVWDPFFYRDAFQYMQAHSDDDFVDIIAANQYNAFRDYWDGSLPTNQEIIAKFLQAVDDASFNPSVARSYSIYKWQTAYGLDNPMASGEVSLQVSSGCGVQTCEELQARHVVHVNVRGLAAGLKIITWYTLKDKPSDSLNYGLVRTDGTLRPAYTAYQVLAQQLDGHVFDQQFVVAGKPNIQAYRFDRDGVKKLVLWRDSGEKIKAQDKDATETMTVSATELGTWTGQVRVTDKLGNVSVHNGDPSVSLTFSSDPIYVEAVQ
jgi:hypothetical protein